MTVYQRFDRVKEVVLCDAIDCDEQRESGWLDTRLTRFDSTFTDSLVVEGWTCWAGRQRRHYCPEHGPKAGHKMHLVWGDAR